MLASVPPVLVRFPRRAGSFLAVLLLIGCGSTGAPAGAGGDRGSNPEDAGTGGVGAVDTAPLEPGDVGGGVDAAGAPADAPPIDTPRDGGAGNTGAADSLGSDRDAVSSDTATRDLSADDAPGSAPPDSGGQGAIYPGVRLFDGTSLAGWTPSAAGDWEARDGAIRSVRGGGRGYLATSADYDDYRVIFTVRLVGPQIHWPTVIIFGTRPPPEDPSLALFGIEVQAPIGNGWDYRMGKNNSGNAFRTRLTPFDFISTEWNQCELMVRASRGLIGMACCPRPGPAPCQAGYVMEWKDPTSGKRGPFALWRHSAQHEQEFKDIYLEPNPTQDELVTTR
jgi:hypothetical protein